MNQENFVVNRKLPCTDFEWVNKYDFVDFKLRNELLKAIQDCGFDHPLEVQKKYLQEAIDGMDIFCQTKPRMGKTTLFILATLQQMNPVENEVSVLVVCHNKELTFQVVKEYGQLSKYITSVKVAAFCEGKAVTNDVKRLITNCPHIIVGTPKRILLLVKSRMLRLQNVKHFVLDDCEKMLNNMGMRRVVQKIFCCLPSEKQVLMFATTLHEKIHSFCKKFMREMTVEKKSEKNSQAEIAIDLYNLKFRTYRYVMWSNRANLCWLDSSMSIIVHNRTLRAELASQNKNSDYASEVKNIIKKYDDAMIIINDFKNKERLSIKLQKIHTKLFEIQESSVNFLQPLMKFEIGQPESAFCCLFNFLNENTKIKEVFNVNFSWLKDCKVCKQTELWKTFTKPIVTLTKVITFIPSAPEVDYQCGRCFTNQNMKVVYRTLPPCLIFHFESGAGQGSMWHCLNFVINTRRYDLTGITVLKKVQNMPHFVTWIRDPTTNNWLDCNDLNSTILTFSNKRPHIELQDVIIMVYEAFDKYGILQVDFEDEMYAVDLNDSAVPCIDISEDTNDTVASDNQKSNSEDGNSSNAIENFQSLKSEPNICSTSNGCQLKVSQMCCQYKNIT